MKPFLKWAGGKYRVLPKIEKILPHGERLIEPFVGSGAVFLSSNISFDSYYLSDSNNDLITLYKNLQIGGLEFIDSCEEFFHSPYREESQFYKLRDTFNKTTDLKLKSRLFIYLNRHCFNGLCRYNKKGGFNVPFGRYKKPYFPRDELINFYEKSKKAQFFHKDFRDTMNQAKKGDVVYCDPPYVPVSKTASFTSYAKGGFDEKDQKDLVMHALKLKENNIPILISNSDTDWVNLNYQEKDCGKILRFDVRRQISGDKTKRNNTGEVLALFK